MLAIFLCLAIEPLASKVERYDSVVFLEKHVYQAQLLGFNQNQKTHEIERSVVMKRRNSFTGNLVVVKERDVDKFPEPVRARDGIRIAFTIFELCYAGYEAGNVYIPRKIETLELFYVTVNEYKDPE